MSPEQALLQQLSGEITRLHRSVVELSEAVSKLAESVPGKASGDVPSARSTTKSSGASRSVIPPITGPVHEFEVGLMMEAVSYDDFERALGSILCMRGLVI